VQSASFDLQNRSGGSIFSAKGFAMKDLTSSVYTFEKLIEGNYLYVDKTEYLWKLVRPASGIYFLSRPRRFGKSLTLSTLKAIFEGKKHLFKDLAIVETSYDWKEYPVIHLDLNGWDFSTPEKMQESLCGLVAECAAKHDLSLESSTPDGMFRELITKVSAKGKVVILVDEYDKPILSNVGKPCAQAILDKLKVFYSVIKAFESSERFVFVTGVSKFSHVSIFSDLNNLNDISMDYDYATMLGYTQRELETNFAEYIELAVKTLKVTREPLLQDIKAWYDGYRFEENSQSVYNPVSIANFFTKRNKFNNYWFDTGTPSFLMELIRKSNFDFENTLKRPVSSMAFKAFEIDRIDPLSLLLQTGYLTIQSMEMKFDMPWYRLDFPNREVSVAFNTYLLNAYVGQSKNEISNFCGCLADAMCTGDVQSLRKILEAFFAGFPYDLHRKNENNFQNIFFALFRLLGYYVEAESRTNNGRIDAVVQTDQWIYLFEFKIDRNAAEAMSQIRNKDYLRKYMQAGKKVFLIGANFSSEDGQISDWVAEEAKNVNGQ